LRKPFRSNPVRKGNLSGSPIASRTGANRRFNFRHGETARGGVSQSVLGKSDSFHFSAGGAPKISMQIDRHRKLREIFRKHKTAKQIGGERHRFGPAIVLRRA
jgi:hypothetical protein